MKENAAQLTLKSLTSAFKGLNKKNMKHSQNYQMYFCEKLIVTGSGTHCIIGSTASLQYDNVKLNDNKAATKEGQKH